ncbi:MAG: DUF4169 family protein [Proteobacteria bacterium]|nr:DUF4169 family protein [Pseudomonadota bacterium]MBI3498037.1 DUF4169 family protein [Pseudomonadota bacterium]
MGEVVNLNKVRKARERAQDKSRAALNRSRHGETKSEKLSRRREEEREARSLEDKRLDS